RPTRACTRATSRSSRRRWRTCSRTSARCRAARCAEAGGEAMNRVVTPPADEDVIYPATDGKPMAETGVHLQTIFWLYEMLRHFFRRRADVYVAADMLLYFEQGNPRASRAPDVMVALGAPSTPERRSFFTW